MNDKWLKKFTDIGMIWLHDGNPRRPYAKLTSGLISDGFIDCTKLIARPKILHDAIRDLLGKEKLPEKPCFVVGQAMGSITIASHIAEILDVPMCWAVKLDNGDMEIDSRFSVPADSTAIVVEDITSTGGTSLKTIGKLKAMDVQVASFIWSIGNRSGMNLIDGYQIRSLADLTVLPIKTWKWGENPHTPDGTEIVEALRPKKRGNWKRLTGPIE